MFCPKCGSQLNDGAAFCNVCGTNLQAGAPAPAPVNPYARPMMAPSHLISGKSVSYKDSNFIFVVIAAIFAFFATFLMHTPVVSVWIKGMGADFSASVTLLDAGKCDMDKIMSAGMNVQNTMKLDLGGQAIGQIIFTILVFASLAYLFLPYIKGTPVNMQMTALNYIVPLAILVFQLIFFVIAVATNPMGEIFNTYVKPALSQMPPQASALGVDAGLGLSLNGWLFYLTNISAIGLLAWQMIVSVFKK